MRLSLSSGVLDIRPILPSKASDYDYDPNNPSRRFYSTMFYEIIFLDSVTGIESFRLLMTSDSINKLCSGVKKIFEKKFKFLSINNGLYAAQTRQPCVMAIASYRSSSLSSITVLLNMKNQYSFTMTIHDVLELQKYLAEIDSNILQF